ncbi:hypothetical protein BJ742DRAFT_340770 [Cladochytrium replicatum]|nr:hypothetical protein BJ742DRAFT_340770 [Cladochytrium replicatum]
MHCTLRALAYIPLLLNLILISLGQPSAEAQAVNVRLTFKMMKSTAEPQHLAFNRLERIGTVRREVARAFNDHADSIRLLLGGKALANDLRTLLDYDVKEGASITVMKKAGGAGGVTAAESVAPNAFGKADDSETSKTVLTQNPEEEFKDAITKLSTKPAFWEGLEGYLQSQFSEKSHADKVRGFTITEILFSCLLFARFTRK